MSAAVTSPAPRLAQVHDHRLVLLRGQHQALEVQDDLGDILDHALQGGELVLVSLILMEVTAAPGIDDSNVRRIEFPRVYPNPGSSGSMMNRERYSATTSSDRVGRCAMSIFFLPASPTI